MGLGCHRRKVRSGRFFYKTTDDQFVLKQMSRFGYLAFLECGMSMEFLSIENFFYKKKISRSYDLKGSVFCERSLYVSQKADKNSEPGDQEGRHLPGQPQDDG